MVQSKCHSLFRLIWSSLLELLALSASGQMGSPEPETWTGRDDMGH